jgi:hypothetical protein
MSWGGRLRHCHGDDGRSGTTGGDEEGRLGVLGAILALYIVTGEVAKMAFYGRARA